MLGPATSRRLDEPIAVSLQALVPADHFSRHLEAELDLHKHKYTERARIDQAPAGACNAWPLKMSCTTNVKARQI